MIVVDCSALLAFLASPADYENLGSILGSSETWCAPDFIDIELAHALRKQERLKRLNSERASTVLEDFGQMRLERYASGDLLHGVWALRHNFSAYDAAYVVLAQKLDAPFLTIDRRLQSAASEHTKITLL